MCNKEQKWIEKRRQLKSIKNWALNIELLAFVLFLIAAVLIPDTTGGKVLWVGIWLFIVSALVIYGVSVKQKEEE